MSDRERVLRDAFAEALGVSDVAADDNFFELGGHSLLVMRAAAHLEARLGINLPVSMIFEHPTARDLAARLGELESKIATPETHRSVAQAPAERVPLSPLQRGMWFLDQGVGWHAAYLLPEVWRLCGSLDVNRLQQALQKCVDRHGAFSTRYTLSNGLPHQMIAEADPLILPVTDLGALPAAERDTICADLISEEANRPFDLSRDSLIRASLIRCARDEHILLLTLHHLAVDAWSLHLLGRELGELYSNRDGAVPSTAWPQRDDVAGRAGEIDDARREELLAYWRQQLKGLPPLNLPADRRQNSTWSDLGDEFRFAIAAELGARLEALALQHGATPQMLLLAAYQLLLARYSDQDDFGVATFASNRLEDALDAIGLFVNTIVIRARLGGVQRFSDLLARVRQTSLDGYDHRELPFDTLVSQLRVDRQAGPNPLAAVAFQYLPISDAPPALAGLEVSRISHPARRVRFDLEFTVRRERDGLQTVVGYRRDRWEPTTIARLASQYCALLGSIADAPDASLADLSYFSGEERHEQLVSWSGEARGPGFRGVVHELFESRAVAAPDRIALEGDGYQLSYGDLNARADRIAALLQSANIGFGDVVAVLTRDTLALVSAMIGILKAGAAYMPLDEAHPPERVAFTVKHARVKAVLVSSAAPDWLAQAANHVIRVPDNHDDLPISETFNRIAITPDAPAYVMFTSGSTGQPKGVTIPHRGITRLVLDADYVDFTADDAVAFASNPAFDAATFEIWGALLNGGRLIAIDRDVLLAPRRLAKAIADHGISVMFLTAALFRQLSATAPDIFGRLRCLIAGGDVVDPASAARVLRTAPPGRLVNGYGPTENTTFSATFRLTSEQPETRTVPIGRPIRGSTCYVLDRNHGLLPVGAIGELYLGGSGLALGYVNDEALTAERFVAHPWLEGERLYKTGDRVRWRSDGQLEFLGRADRQVKLRGHRIELEEIEQVLSLHPAVAACAVTLETTAAGDSRLYAYVASRDGQALRPAALADHLRRRVPDFMIPALFIELPELPLTANRKVGRAALSLLRTNDARPACDRRATGDSCDSPLRAQVASAFRNTLRLEHVDPDANFFDLGGDSLASITLTRDLAARTGRDVSVTDVFAHPSVAELSAMLTKVNDRVVPNTLVEVRGGTGTPIYFPPGALGEVLVTPTIRDALPEHVPVYAFRQPLDAPPDVSMEAMAARLCADLEGFQPAGAVSLAGYSFAGLLAYEMARQLKARGRKIRLLAIFDTGPDLSAGGGARGAATRAWLCLKNLPVWIDEDLIRSLDRDTVGRLWRSLKKHVRAGFRFRSAAPGVVPRVDHLFDVTQWSPALYALVENNLKILGAFEYRSYDGDIVLFRARARPLLHAQTWDLGWQPLARSVRVIPAPGNHHTLMLEPHIQQVARGLGAVVDEAESGV